MATASPEKGLEDPDGDGEPRLNLCEPCMAKPPLTATGEPSPGAEEAPLSAGADGFWGEANPPLVAEEDGAREEDVAEALPGAEDDDSEDDAEADTEDDDAEALRVERFVGKPEAFTSRGDGALALVPNTHASEDEGAA